MSTNTTNTTEDTILYTEDRDGDGDAALVQSIRDGSAWLVQSAFLFALTILVVCIIPIRSGIHNLLRRI